MSGALETAKGVGRLREAGRGLREAPAAGRGRGTRRDSGRRAAVQLQGGLRLGSGSFQPVVSSATACGFHPRRTPGFFSGGEIQQGKLPPPLLEERREMLCLPEIPVLNHRHLLGRLLARTSDSS